MDLAFYGGGNSKPPDTFADMGSSADDCVSAY